MTFSHLSVHEIMTIIDIILFSGLVIGQHDNDQILAITHEQKGEYHYNI